MVILLLEKKRIKLISLEGAGDNFLGGCFKKMLTLTQGQHFFIFIKDDNTDYFCIIAFLSSFCLLYYLGKNNTNKEKSKLFFFMTALMSLLVCFSQKAKMKSEILELKELIYYEKKVLRMK